MALVWLALLVAVAAAANESFTPVKTDVNSSACQDATQPGNPLGMGATTMASVTKVGQSNVFTIVDYTTNITHTAMTTEYVMTSTNGDSIRTCDALTSTEKGADGDLTTRPLQILADAPITVMVASNVNGEKHWLPQAVATIRSPYALVDMAELEATPGGPSDPVYMAAINVLLQQIANNPKGPHTRRLADAETAVELHPEVHAVLLTELQDRMTFLRRMAGLKKASKPRGKTRHAMDLFLEGEVYTTPLIVGDMHIGGLPIEPDIWAATKHVGHLAARVEYAEALQHSRLRYLDDVHGNSSDAPHRRGLSTRTSVLELSEEEMRLVAPHKLALTADMGRRASIFSFCMKGLAVIGIAGALYAGYKYLSNNFGGPSGPGTNPGPALGGIVSTLSDMQVTMQKLSDTTASLNKGLVDTNARITGDEDNMKTLTSQFNAFQGTQLTWDHNADTRMNYLQDQQAEIMANTSKALADVSAAIQQTAVTLQHSIVATQAAITNLTNYAAGIRSDELADIAQLNSQILAILDAVEEVQLSVYELHLQPVLRNALASQVTYMIGLIAQSSWYPIINTKLHDSLQPDPPRDWQDGSPNRAFPIDVFPVTWAELNSVYSMTSKEEGGDWSTYASSSAAPNFDFHYMLVGLYCDFYDLEARYRPDMNADRVTSLINQAGCKPHWTNVSVPDFVMIYAGSYATDKRASCHCWFETADTTCSVAVDPQKTLFPADPNSPNSITAAGLYGIAPSSGRGSATNTPCGSNVPTAHPKQTYTAAGDWQALWNNISSNPRRWSSNTVPSLAVGSMGASNLNTSFLLTVSNGHPLALTSFIAPAGAPATAAQDADPGTNAYKLASMLTKLALRRMGPGFRDAKRRAHGFLSEDITVNGPLFAFESTSELDYVMYETEFAGARARCPTKKT